MTLIARYLSLGELSDNKAEAYKIQVQVARFSLINSQLYKRSLCEPYLKCLIYQQGQYILAELYNGICENYPDDGTLAHKAHTQGYNWLTMHVDVAAYVRRCDCC